MVFARAAGATLALQLVIANEFRLLSVVMLESLALLFIVAGSMCEDWGMRLFLSPLKPREPYVYIYLEETASCAVCYFCSLGYAYLRHRFSISAGLPREG